MKLLQGIKDPKTLSNLYYLCIDIIGKSNECRRGPGNASGCVDLKLQYNNGIEKNKGFVKKFNNLLQHHKEIFSLYSFCNNNNIEQNHPDFLNFINLLILRLEKKNKKYERPEINYFSGQIIFSYIKKYIIDNYNITTIMKDIPEKITTKIGKLIVPPQSLPAYSLGSTPSHQLNFAPPSYRPQNTSRSSAYGFPSTPVGSSLYNNSSEFVGGSRKKKIQRKRKTKKTKKNKK